MRKFFALLLWLPLLLGALEYVPGQMIVQTSQPRQITRNALGLTSLDSYLASKQVKEVKPVFAKADNRFYLIELSEEIDFSEVQNMRFSGVETIEPNYLNRFYLEPNDLAFEQQRIQFENINLPQAWDYTTGNNEVLIAVIDSGLYFDHPDLQENVFYNPAENSQDGTDSDNNFYVDDWRGWDFVDAPELANIGLGDFTGQDNDPTDEIGHGTHIAGIIGATTNNELGVSGSLWNTKMMIIRAGFNSTLGGFLQNDDAAAAIIYAADMGADVITISWGDVEYSALIDYAITYAHNQGSIIVCAAGNEGSNPEHNITYPAKFANTISVGAVNSQKQWASFSSYGPELDLVAPGVQIFSTYNSSGENIYYEQSGTSMAAPFVAAAVALLLSVEPDLTFEEVKTRLLTTAEDLGPVGFDNKFGYGMLDTFNMLSNPATPQVEISFPADQGGFSQSFDIYGTARVTPEEDFFRYSLTYTTEVNPTATDWQNVNPEQALYHYTAVEDGYLGSFIVQDLMPDGEYKLKLEVVTANQQHYRTIHQITIDQSAAQLDPSRSFVLERYYDEFNRYYIGAVYDDLVDLEITENNSGTKYYSNFSDSLQILHIPDNGFNNISLDLKATNSAGTVTTEESAFLFENVNKTVDTNSWEQTFLDKQLISIRSTFDFDNNGVQEIVALQVQADSSRVAKAFEISGNQLVEKHIFPFGSLFWPYDVGSMSEGKKHLLGVTSITASVYEAAPGSDYPNVAVYAVEDSYGGRFLDATGNGLMEVALSRNIQVNNINRKVITISQRINGEFTEIDTLWNWTPSNSINAFTNQMEAADFNQNGIPEILVADSDGDVMLFENGEPFWGARMPVGNVENMAIGDFDADGSIDFCVGGYNFDVADPARSFSYYAFFTYSATEADYVEMGSISFDNLEVRNSLVAADLNGDLSAEAIIQVPPNIYLVDYQEGEFVPIWKGEAAKTFKNVLVAQPQTVENSAKIIAPIWQNGALTSSLISVSEDFAGPPTPTGFRAAPADSSRAILSWDEHTYQHLVVYRKYQDNIEEIATVSGTEYSDSGLQTSQSYEYSIAGYDDSYTPALSHNTLWKEVVPTYVPQLLSLQMCSPYELKLSFDQNLHNNSVNVQHFSLNNEIGPPASVNFINSKQGLLLSFAQPFVELDNYQLHISGLQGATGLQIPDGSFAFQYAADTTPPRIISAQTISVDQVRVYFSETMQDESVEELENYFPVFPLIDNSNRIIAVESGSDTRGYYVELSFANELKFSNQSYFLKLKKMTDLSGNLISNNGNKCSFTLTEIVDLKHMIVYPNPLYLSQFEEIRFVNLPLQKAGNIRIYDLAGELVFSDKIAPLTELKNYYSWNAKNSKGKSVSSGMYLYFIKVGNDFKKGKLAVIH